MPKKESSQNESENTKETKVSVKKILYIDIDEEIPQIFDRIKRLNFQEIFLVVPAQSVLFQSIVNLKILKRKAEDMNKKISIITQDGVGMHLAHKAGLSVYDHVDDSYDASQFHKLLNPKLRISPLEATSNPKQDDKPRLLSRKKMSIADLIRRHANIVKSSSIPKRNLRKTIKHLGFFSLHRRFLTGLSFVSILILLAISYVTLPRATIYITPKSNVLEISVNIVLADAEINVADLSTHPPHMIALYPVSTTLRKIFTYPSTQQTFHGENAIGNITIVNESEYDWPLLAKTRFQTEDGLVFRTFAFVNVPRATAAGKGTLDVSVQADPYDAFGQAVGARGNIGLTPFFLPALTESSRKLLYAQSSEPFTGGVTQVTYSISEEDVQNAREKSKTEIRLLAMEELKNYITTLNTSNDTTLAILEDERAIVMSEPRVVIAEGLVSQEIASFDVEAEIDISGVVFNNNEFLGILRNELKLRKSPAKRLVDIDPASAYYRIFEINESLKRYKLTATLKGIEEYEIDLQNQNGARLIEKIIEHVIGKKIEEASDYLQNLPEINKVDIESWPVWAPTMPKVGSNIEVQVLKEGESIED